MTRQPHADFIIMQANNMSLRFDYKDKRTGNWILCQESPCEFNPNWEYRLHEREFPKTSLSDKGLEDIVNAAVIRSLDDSYIYRNVANAVIKQYILDTEKESK